jgi:hypothetical protein
VSAGWHSAAAPPPHTVAALRNRVIGFSLDTAVGREVGEQAALGGVHNAKQTAAVAGTVVLLGTAMPGPLAALNMAWLLGMRA